jgi:hypothetical protein
MLVVATFDGVEVEEGPWWWWGGARAAGGGLCCGLYRFCCFYRFYGTPSMVFVWVE